MKGVVWFRICSHCHCGHRRQIWWIEQCYMQCRFTNPIVSQWGPSGTRDVCCAMCENFGFHYKWKPQCWCEQSLSRDYFKNYIRVLVYQWTLTVATKIVSCSEGPGRPINIQYMQLDLFKTPLTAEFIFFIFQIHNNAKEICSDLHVTDEDIAVDCLWICSKIHRGI